VGPDQGGTSAVLESLRMITALVTGIGVVLLFAAAVGRLPRRATLALLAVAEVAVVAGVLIDIAWLVRGNSTPELLTHIGYLITTPLLIPAGLGLTYRKIDRWGLLIVGVATLITAVMIIRQVQTLGLRFGFLNA
jgi:hypothetical protein